MKIIFLVVASMFLLSCYQGPRVNLKECRIKIDRVWKGSKRVKRKVEICEVCDSWGYCHEEKTKIKWR